MSICRRHHKLRTFTLAVSLLAGLAFTAACQSNAGGGGGSGNNKTGGDAAAGELKFQQSCAGCHENGGPDLAGSSAAQIEGKLTTGPHEGGSAAQLGVGGNDYADLAAALGGNAGGGDTPGGDTPGGTEPGGDTPGGDTPGGTEPGGDTPGGDTPGGTEPGGDTPGGDTPGGTEPGGDTPGGDTPGGTEPGGDAPGGPGTGSGGAVDPTLVGTWVYEDNFWSGDFSSTTSTTAVLSADGTYQVRTIWWGGDPGVSGSSDENVLTGRWTAAGGILSLTYDDGSLEEFGYYTEYMAGDLLLLLTDPAGNQTLWTYQG